MGIYGIDVSNYQSANFPTSVQGHPVDFAFIKATEGTSYVNPKQPAQTAWARSRGMVVGFYHFLHAGNIAAQAAYFVAKASSVAGDILACDWEMTGVSGADKDAFMKAVKELRPDHRVILYSDKNHWTNIDKTSYCGDGLWLANYNGSPGTTGVSHAVMIHQYTSTPVDTNFASAWASRAEMKAWAAGSKAPSTPTTPEDDMPQLVNLGVAKPYSLAPSTNWNAIEFTSEFSDEPGGHAAGGSVFLVGKARFTGTLWLDLSGLDVGQILQVRQTEIVSATGVTAHDHPITEVVGTSGHTYAAIPLGGDIPAGHSMRVRLVTQQAKAVTVEGATLKAFVWK